MSNTLRMLLMIVAILTAIWILNRIRRMKVKMEDAIFWMVFAVILLVLGLFPELSFRLTRLLGVMSPANLIFLVIIFLLIEKIFTMSIIQSQLEDKIMILAAELALRTHDADRRLKQNEPGQSEIIPGEPRQEKKGKKEPDGGQDGNRSRNNPPQKNLSKQSGAGTVRGSKKRRK